MTGISRYYPEQFCTSLIRAIEAKASKSVDDRIKTIVIEKNLLAEFTGWIDENPKWAKQHSILVHDLMVLSLTQGNIKGIDVIEEIVHAIWGMPATATWQSQDDLANAMKQNNRLSLCSALFRYVERIPFVDMKIIETGFGKLSKEEQARFVNLTNLHGQNVFHICAGKNKSEAFDLFFEALTNPEILNDENSYGTGPLNIAIDEAKNPEMVKKILKAFDKHERMVIVKTILAGSRVLHQAMRADDGLRIFKAVFQSIPKNDRLEAIKVLDKNDSTLLDYAVKNQLGKAGKEVVGLLPMKDRLDILQISPRINGAVPPVHLAASLGQIDLFNDISNLLSKEDQVKIRLFCDKKGRNMLHHALSSTNEYLIEAVIKPVSCPMKCKELVLKADHEEKTPLHEAAIRVRAKAIAILLNAIPKIEEREEGMDQKDSQGCSAMHYALMNGDAALNEAIFDVMPLEYGQKVANYVEKLMQEKPQSAAIVLRGIKTVIPGLIPHLLPKFEVHEIYSDKKIHLLGRNADFLDKACKIIADYTQKVDPDAVIKKCEIKKITDADDLEAGFTHYVAIQKILPRPVRAFFGRSTPWVYRNCHGAAVVAAGIYPQISHLEKPDDSDGVKAHTSEVPLEQLCTGDWVYLKSGPIGTKFPGESGAHSFVFLSHDLCLSMNGKNKELGLYATPGVLNAYGYRGDVLYTTDPDADELKERISILRKKPDWTYPDVQTPNSW
jgi:ankyrin repeat protein